MFKKITVFCIVITFWFITSCAVELKEEFIRGYSVVRFSSLKKYADKGFLITPSETYGANYNSIGFISIEKMLDAEAKIVEKKVEIPDPERPGRKKEITKKNREWSAPNLTELELETMIDEIYQQSRSKGADAIINFKIELIERELSNPSELQVGGRVSGFAIDRLD
tara:strand:+ start:174 stop:674 length:501 start_codon:yes stop_codon:yes gene_type:complete